MSSTVIYLRGTFPSDFAPKLNDDRIDDLKNILKVDKTVLDSVFAKLEQFQFVGERELQEAAALCPDVRTTSLVVRVIQWVKLLYRDDDDLKELLRRLASLKSKEEQPKPAFTTEDMARLGTILEGVYTHNGLRRQTKAEKLADAAGQKLESVQILCDLRPVFDDARDRIEGMFPITILKIVSKGIDGLPVGLDVVLSEKDLDDLHKMTTTAKVKLERMRSFLSNARVPLPLTALASEPLSHAK